MRNLYKLRPTGFPVAPLLVVGTLFVGFLGTAATVARAAEAHDVRVLYIEDGQERQAMTRLRREVALRTVAVLDSSGALVVTDSADRLDRCEDLLVADGILIRSATPHAPLADDDSPPRETRSFRLLDGDEVAAFATVLRSIYRIRQLEASPAERTLAVTASRQRLDAIEATLSELELLEAVER